MWLRHVRFNRQMHIRVLMLLKSLADDSKTEAVRSCRYYRAGASGVCASRLPQGGLVIEPVHAVEVLHGDAAGAAEEVVFAGEDEDAAADDAHGEIEEVGAGAIFRGRQVLDHADERGLGVVGAVKLQQLLL